MVLMMMMYFYSAFSIISAQICFKHFAGGHSQTVLSSLHWREICAGALNIGIFGHKVRPQHWEKCLLLFV